MLFTLTFSLSCQSQTSDTLKMASIQRCKRQIVYHCRRGNENVANLDQFAFSFQLAINLSRHQNCRIIERQNRNLLKS